MLPFAWSLSLFMRTTWLSNRTGDVEPHDWRAWFRRNGQTKLGRLTNGFKGCEGVELDIFYKPEWYSGMNPSPMEFMFLKMNPFEFG